MSATFRKDKNGIHEDKDRGHGKHWKCKCERCQLGRQHKHLKSDDHIPAAKKMIECPHCKKPYNEGTQEAEFIGWHGICAECELKEGE